MTTIYLLLAIVILARWQFAATDSRDDHMESLVRSLQDDSLAFDYQVTGSDSILAFPTRHPNWTAPTGTVHAQKVVSQLCRRFFRKITKLDGYSTAHFHRVLLGLHKAMFPNVTLFPQ